MDLKEFYNENIKDSEYHYKFYEIINTPVKIYNFFNCDEEIKNISYEVFDDEEAIIKFKELCQPEIEFDDENRNWFYLITYYLYKKGYILKEFPGVLERPPMKPSDFTYEEIRNHLIAIGEDVKGIVKYSTRRIFVSNFTFERKSNYIEIDESIDSKFKEISTRKASFNNMSTDEKLKEIANLIELLLKKNGKYLDLNYSEICYEYISNDIVKDFRRKIQCFRHATEEALDERNLYTKEQKDFFIDYGLIIIKVIQNLVGNNNI